MHLDDGFRFSRDVLFVLEGANNSIIDCDGRVDQHRNGLSVQCTVVPGEADAVLTIGIDYVIGGDDSSFAVDVSDGFDDSKDADYFPFIHLVDITDQ